MANAIHKINGRVVRSIDASELPIQSDWVIFGKGSDLNHFDKMAKLPKRHLKFSGGKVSEKSAAERKVADDEHRNSQLDHLKTQFDSDPFFQALVAALLKRINVLEVQAGLDQTTVADLRDDLNVEV